MVFKPSYQVLTLSQVASRTIAELCRKFGERIVGEIMAILKTKMASANARTREGVCLTVAEIMYAILSSMPGPFFSSSSPSL